jgi:hypothetical protein
MGTFSPPNQTGTRYRVYMTPRVSQFKYGTEVEVTTQITSTGINQIKRALDSQDYEIGVYFYSDLELTGSNDNGYFNESTDLRSIFGYNRDLTKCRVVFENTAGDTITYYGLINDAATRIDALNETVTFRILSLDSVISKTQVAGGTISNGATVQAAIFNLLNQAAISSILSVSIGNINPNTTFTIDLGDAFDDMQTQDALNLLLVASNSVMKITSSGVVTVQGRLANSTVPLNLYGPFDELRRQNVINIQNYNTGLQRMFTSVLITDGNSGTTVFDNVALAQTYGYNQTTLDFPFLTSAGNIATVGKAILAEFSSPKVEMEIEVPTNIAKSADLLDLVSINWPLRITPAPGAQFMPVIGVATIGNSAYPLPTKRGSLYVIPQVAFKVIEIDQDPNTFTSILKLRQIGTTLSDGYFINPTSSIIGYAIVGVAPVGGTSSRVLDEASGPILSEQGDYIAAES